MGRCIFKGDPPLEKIDGKIGIEEKENQKRTRGKGFFPNSKGGNNVGTFKKS